MKDPIRVDYDELELVVGQTHSMYWNGQPFTGVAVDLYPDGKLMREVHFVDGLEHGPSREWHESGILSEEAEMLHGGLHGAARTWDEKGRLRAESFGEWGVTVSYRAWDEAGNLTMDWIIGPEDGLYNHLLRLRQRFGPPASQD